MFAACCLLFVVTNAGVVVLVWVELAVMHFTSD